MAESVERTQDELSKLRKLLEEMTTKMDTIERNVTNLHGIDDDETIIQSASDPDGFEMSHERFLATYTREMLNQNRNFEKTMANKAETIAETICGSEPDRSSQNPGNRLQKWLNNIEEDTSEEENKPAHDSAVDVRTPDGAKRPPSHASSPTSQDTKAARMVSFDQNPDFIRDKVDFYQKEVERLETAGAYSEARSCQQESIKLLNALELRHHINFVDRIVFTQRLARLHVLDETLESYEDAEKLLEKLEEHEDEKALTSELHQLLATAYLKKGSKSLAREHARIALDDREKLPGPPAPLIAESADFLIKYYEKENTLHAAAEAHSLKARYGKYFMRKGSVNPDRRMPQPVVLSSLPTDERARNAMSEEMVWLRISGFDVRPTDYRNLAHPNTQLTPIIALLAVNEPAELNMLRRIIDGGADVNGKDHLDGLGMTPIMWAVKHINLKALDLLLNCPQIDTRLQDHRGRTAMHISVDEDTTTAAERLYKQDDELIQIPDHFGRTPLHYAVERKSMKMTKFLLRRGGEVNKRDTDGQTVLHVAVQNDAFELAKHLLNDKDHSPDLSICNNDGQNAFEIAKNKGRNSRIYALFTKVNSPPVTATVLPPTRVARAFTAEGAMSPISPGRTSTNGQEAASIYSMPLSKQRSQATLGMSTENIRSPTEGKRSRMNLLNGLRRKA